MTMVMKMKTPIQNIPAGEFKSKCLKIMDEVKLHHRTIVITKHGKPIAKLIPFEETPISLFGVMKDSIKIQGDIVSPIDEHWDAENE